MLNGQGLGRGARRGRRLSGLRRFGLRIPAFSGIHFLAQADDAGAAVTRASIMLE